MLTLQNLNCHLCSLTVGNFSNYPRFNVIVPNNIASRKERSYNKNRSFKDIFGLKKGGLTISLIFCVACSYPSNASKRDGIR